MGRDLFAEMDQDGIGTISLDDVKVYFKDPRVMGFFTALGLDPNDTERLFSLIDDDGSGDVDVNEFLDGCLRLKGQARSIDVYAVMHDIRGLDGKICELSELLGGGHRRESATHAPRGSTGNP